MKILNTLLVLLFSLSAFAQAIIDKDLLINNATDAPIEFLVILKDKANLAQAKNIRTKNERANYVFKQLKTTAENSQARLIAFLEKEKVAHYQTFYVVNAISVTGSLALIKKIAKLEEVESLQANTAVQMAAPAEQSEIDLRGPNTIEWGIEMINADDVWAMGFRGQNVVVAGEDTGYDWTHPALKNAYRGWDGTTADHNYHWHDAIHQISPLNDTINDASLNPCGLDVREPCDDNNHGTHTMGTIVGEDGDNQIGVAPAARWMACRNMERGYGSPASYIECFEFFLAPTDLNGENPRPELAPHVINNSWSCPEMEGCNPDNWAIMEQAVENLRQSGVVVVVSAGNSGRAGCETVQTPAAMFEGSFTIGATNIMDTIADFSSRGPVTVDGSNRRKPNVSAPGVGVRSSVRGGGYASFSGTSMAGPHVAGLVALLISAQPELAGQVEKIESIIETSAVKKTSSEDCGGLSTLEIPNNVYGFGRVDALAAVQIALNISDVKDSEATADLKVFPNPFTDELTFASNYLQGQTLLEIFEVNGRLLKAETLHFSKGQAQVVPMPNLTTGIYFYRLTNKEVVLQAKILKQ